MTGNEEKLRRVLAEEASGTLPSANAWPRIHEGVDRRRKWRMLMQYGGATAGATAAIVAGVMFANSGAWAPDAPAASPTTALASAASPNAETREASPTYVNSDLPTVDPSSSPTSTPTPEDLRPQVPASELGRLGPNIAAIVDVDAGITTALRVALVSKQDGTIARYLTEDRGETGVSNVAASPDGKYVYYIGFGGYCAGGVYRVPVTGGAAQQVIAPDEDVIAFAMNGSGTRIAALRTNCRGRGAGDIVTSIDEYDAVSGVKIRQLLQRPDEEQSTLFLAGHPLRDQLAVVNATQAQAVDRVDLMELSPTGLKNTQTVMLTPCAFGGTAGAHLRRRVIRRTAGVREGGQQLEHGARPRSACAARQRGCRGAHRCDPTAARSHRWLVCRA